MKNQTDVSSTGGKKEQLWSPTFILMIVTALGLYFCTQMQATVFPLFTQTLGGNLTLAGLTTSVYMGISMLFKPIAGSLLDKYNRKFLLIGALLCFAGVVISYSGVTMIGVLLLLRAVCAPFYSVANTATATIATVAIPKSRMTEGLGYYNLSQTVTMALGPGLGLWLIEMAGYSAVFKTCSLVAIAAAALAFALPRQVKKDDQAQSTSVRAVSVNSRKKKTLLIGIKNLSVVLPALLMLLVSLGCSGINTFLPTFGRQFNITGIGVFFTVEAISMFVVRLFIGKFTERFGTPIAIFISMICICLSLIGIFFSRSLIPILIIAAVFGIGYGAIMPLLHSLAVENITADHAGTANSLFFMGSEAGICMSSVLLGIIADLIGIEWLFLTGGFIIIPAMLIYTFSLYQKSRKKQSA